MGKPFQHINYSFEEIERYLQGRMSPVEMHALEKAALQDPFLADAIEGYEASDLLTVESDLAEIQSRLLQAGEDTKVVPLRAQKQWWKIAAMIIVLAGAGVLGWKLVLDPSLQKESATVANVSAIKQDTLAERTQMPGKIALAKPGAPHSELSKIENPKSRAANTDKTKPASAKAGKIFEINDELRKEGLVASSGYASSGLRLTPAAPDFIAANNAEKERIENILRGKVAGISVLNNPNVRLSDMVFTSKPATPDNIALAKKYVGADSIVTTAKLTTLGGNPNIQNQKAALTREQAYVSPSLAAEGFGLSLTNGAFAALSSLKNFTTTGEVTASLLNPSPASLDEVVVTGYSTKKRTLTSGAVIMKKEESNDATANRDFKRSPELYKKPGNMFVSPSGGWGNFKAALRGTIRRFKKDEAVAFGDVEVKVELDKKGMAKEAIIIRSYDPSVNDLVIKAVKKHKRWEILVDAGPAPQSVVFTIQL